MNRTSRAKQFLPFDALEGFRKALAEKEEEYDVRKEFTEESFEELESQFNRLEKGSKTIVKYYKNKKYNEIYGTVTNIDYIKRKIQINGENINVCDIEKIEVE